MQRTLALFVIGFGLTAAVTAYAGPTHTFRLEPAGPTTVEAGDPVMVQAVFDTIAISQGWSFGVCHDEQPSSLDGAVAGATTLTIAGGEEADFVQINLQPGGVTMGVVISFLGLFTLAPGLDYEILDISYTALDPGLTDEDPPLPTEICYCNSLGDPPVATVIVVGGQSIVPTQMCAMFEFIPPPTVFCDLTCVGEVVEGMGVVTVTIDHSDFDYLLLHKNGELIALIDDLMEGGGTVEFIDDMDILPGDTVTYQLVGVLFEDPMDEVPTTCFSSCTLTIVSLQVDEPLGDDRGFFYGGDTITITGLGFTIGTDLMVDFGGVPGIDLMVISDSELTVVTPASDSIGFVDVTVTSSLDSITVVDGFFYGFVRGDVDCNRAVDIGDAQFGLLYLFQQGDDPCCFDALDANDDGLLDAADPIYILQHLFDSGPPLPAPFPDPLPEILDPASVGDDPTGDGIICI